MLIGGPATAVDHGRKRCRVRPVVVKYLMIYYD